MNIISYFFLRFMIILVGIMPFRMMYVLSDIIFFVIYHLIGYRRKVVLANLSSCFPEKSKNEIRLLEIKFYHHFCDISLESIKGFSMSPLELVKRHRFLNPELTDFYFNKGVSVIALPAHYNNWEWGSMSPGLQIQHPNVVFYKPMSNQLTDSFVKKHRARFNTKLASIRETALTFNALSSSPHAYIMAADQSPSNVEDAYWHDFLNHETAWLHGPEKYARNYNWPLLYVDIQKVKRGFYELKLVLLTESPASLPDGEITRLYAQHLEKSILQEPAYWLWSHRRWKHVRERD